jgi:Holliday junction resolvase
MPNYHYNKGVRKERKIVNEAKAEGCIAFRSAGSHSPIDVCIIDIDNGFIRFVQSKGDSITPRQVQKLMDELVELNTQDFKVSFEVI